MLWADRRTVAWSLQRTPREFSRRAFSTTIIGDANMIIATTPPAAGRTSADTGAKTNATARTSCHDCWYAKAKFSPYLSPAAPKMMHSGDFLTIKSARDQMHRCVKDFDAHACSGQSWSEQLERTYQQPAPRLRRIRDLHPYSIRGKVREHFSWPGAAQVTNVSPQGRLAARP